MARTPRRLDDYRRGQREREIEREAFQRDRRYDEVQDRIVEDYLRQDRDEVLRTIINDDMMTVSPEMVEIINDPTVEMTADMRVRRKPMSESIPTSRNTRRPLGSGTFSSQFGMQGFDLPVRSRRTRKKSSNDTRMSKALKQANKRLRNKNGRLKKGKTMRDVMKLAHRLRKK